MADNLSGHSAAEQPRNAWALKLCAMVLRRKAAIPTLCYAVAICLWLVVSLCHAVTDAAQTADGALAEQTLSATDFALVDLTVQGTGVDIETGAAQTELVTTSADPQMILEDVSAQTVRNLRLYASFSADPREMCLYYTTKHGQDYSKDRRVFPTKQTDGSYLFLLPRGDLVSLRLDPCSPEADTAMELQVQKVILNQPTPLWKKFLPSWYQAFCLALYPGLAAATLSLARQWFLWWKQKQ